MRDVDYASTVRPLRRTVRTAISMPARLMAGKDIIAVTITNYSATGLSVTTATERVLEREATATIFMTEHSVRGRPIWQRDRSIGVEFVDTPMAIDTFLRALVGPPQAPPKVSDAPPVFVIGQSALMRRALARAKKAASSLAPVFITGETGTGKDMMASFIHANSPRRDGPFVPINCASLSGQMAESDLFGHRKGAFTGAINDRAGAVARAVNGTLFLDEFVELDAKEQARLLRFTQSGEYMRLGDETVARSNARLICATNRSPAEEIRHGRLRSDLFYRVNTIPIHLAPLRERREDISVLSQHFLSAHTKSTDQPIVFDSAAAAWMLGYHWPGNIRQLSNAILQCVALADGALIGRVEIETAAVSTAELEDVKTAVAVAATDGATPGTSLAGTRPLETVITETIERAIREAHGSIPKAAQALEISPSTIYRRFKQDKRADDGSSTATLP